MLQSINTQKLVSEALPVVLQSRITFAPQRRAAASLQRFGFSSRAEKRERERSVNSILFCANIDGMNALHSCSGSRT